MLAGCPSAELLKAENYTSEALRPSEAAGYTKKLYY